MDKKNNKTNSENLASENNEIFFRCPKCLGAIKAGVCINCSFIFKKDFNDIYRLTDNINFYFREKMPKQSLLKVVQAEDISKACYQVFKNELKWRYDFYAFDSTRGMGALLGNFKPDSVVLDYGCGWGNIAKFMSYYAGKVVAVDMTYESLLFCKRTSVKNNIIFLHGGDGKYLPFTDNIFDIVFLNGVLEWIPEYELSGDPKEVQLNFLKNIKKILKPGGQIIIGIENRYAAKYFLGTPDEHSRLLFTSILPRKMSVLISKIKNKKPYRTYTYSYWGYKKLLKTAGFSDIEIDIPYPSYREIDNLLMGRNLKYQRSAYQESLEFKKKTLKKNIKDFFIGSSLMKYFSHSYLIRSNAGTGSLLEKILNFKNDKLGDLKTIINQHHKCTFLVETEKFFYKIPSALPASLNLKKEVDTVNELSRSDDLREFLSHMECLTINGMSIQIIRKEKVIYNVPPNSELIDIFFKIKKKTIIKKRCNEIYSLKNIQKFLEYNNDESLFEDFIKFLGNKFVDCSFSHGDFHTRNMISIKDGIKIIDWEFYSPVAPLEIDYINLILYEESFLSGRTYYEVVKDFLEKRLKISDNNRFKNYQSFINSASPQIMLLYCLQHHDFDIGRYEGASFIPYLENTKIKKIIGLLENFIKINNEL